jgi:hypothetical protein
MEEADQPFLSCLPKDERHQGMNGSQRGGEEKARRLQKREDRLAPGLTPWSACP